MNEVRNTSRPRGPAGHGEEIETKKDGEGRRIEVGRRATGDTAEDPGRASGLTHSRGPCWFRGRWPPTAASPTRTRSPSS
jgi:hypothetical protein